MTYFIISSDGSNLVSYRKLVPENAVFPNAMHPELRELCKIWWASDRDLLNAVRRLFPDAVSTNPALHYMGDA